MKYLLCSSENLMRTTIKNMWGLDMCLYNFIISKQNMNLCFSEVNRKKCKISFFYCAKFSPCL